MKKTIANLSGKAAQNNTDPAAVLDAGWKAMQAADPGLATAIGKMPPQMAQNAVMQYTNAIRMGKETEASAMAAEAVRAGFASMQAPAPAAGLKRLGFLGNRPQHEIGDVNSFNKAIAPAAQVRAPRAFNFGRLGQLAAQQQQTQQQSAFKSVKDQYDAYEMSGYTDDDKKISASYGMALDPAKKKTLAAPAGWSLPKPPEQSGLINNAISTYNGSDGM